MKISFLWLFEDAHKIFPFWKDGLRKALELIELEHEVEWIYGGLEPSKDTQFMLFWDDSSSQKVLQFKDYKCRKGLVLTTDLGLNIENLRNYDVIFAEAQPVVDKVRSHGIRVIKAFGTDEGYWFDAPTSPIKPWEAFYPATFSRWKRQDIFSEEYKDRGLLLGTIQPDGWDIFKKCIENRTPAMVGYVNPDVLKKFYQMSKKVHITGWEGSGRTVLEALSMDLSAEVADDNHKCQSYIQEWKDSGLEPREFILEHYSAGNYARQLLEGILQ